MEKEDLVSHAIEHIKHYLPSQAPLKDFVHHNTLHAFQNHKFHDGIQLSSQIFGTKIYLTFSEYQKMYSEKVITDGALKASLKKIGNDQISIDDLMNALDKDIVFNKRVGTYRSLWKNQYQIDLDTKIHPLLFRYLSNYLDQGISNWINFSTNKGFLAVMRELEGNPISSLFKNKKGRARRWLFDNTKTIEDLLLILVDDYENFERYLFDQQFAHPGWSGLVTFIEENPDCLYNKRSITLKEVIFFELLMEIDAIDYELGKDWKPLRFLNSKYPEIFSPKDNYDKFLMLQIWHEAMENSFYDETLLHLATQSRAYKSEVHKKTTPSFQALFCIDDRECSFRQYVEEIDEHCLTYGTPGFFGVEFYFKPYKGRHYTKLCPAPLNPQYLIKETVSKHKYKSDILFNKQTHSFWAGWLISQTLGFWSAFKLFISIFRPSVTQATASSLNHTFDHADLKIEFQEGDKDIDGLKPGFTINEMTQRVYNTLMSIGLVENFSSMIYLVGHGASSVNNPHYAAYDCGACSGRPGSVNARVFAFMANHKVVREKLADLGVVIPESTVFLGGIHDTTRDDIMFYDEEKYGVKDRSDHLGAKIILNKALVKNALERARRFESININKSKKVYDEIKKRSVSLFEPRPELNHATNSLCIVGRRHITKDVFLDRRAFLNSYDYRLDSEGEILTRLLNAIAPVCGGINLEYYFSRVDNSKLGAGTKLPHNVIGLIGVANGADGDLRPGLPSQMIEVHDPIRLLVVVEHKHETALKAAKRNPATYEWIKNEWIKYSCIDPDDGSITIYSEGEMRPYKTSTDLNMINNMDEYIKNRGHLKIGLVEHASSVNSSSLVGHN